MFNLVYAKAHGASGSQLSTSFAVGMVVVQPQKAGGKIVTDPTKTLQLAMVQGAISGAVSGGIYAMINDTKLSRGIL